jgi:hypothetical protein
MRDLGDYLRLVNLELDYLHALTEDPAAASACRERLRKRMAAVTQRW